MEYYYFGASLPTLSWEEPPPLSSEEFLSMCDRLLSRQDAETMRSLASDPVAENPPSAFAQAWRDREIQLRNALVRIRAGRIGRDASVFLRVERTVDASIEKAAADAFSRPNPGEREREIDQLRWRQIDDLAGLSPFSETAVFAYGLKLKILERWAAVDAAKGQEIVQGIVTRPPALEGLSWG